MLVKMNRQEFESFDLNELGWRCMAPIMEPLRGKNPSEKTQVYSELTGGQQVLFMFYAYYNHAYKSVAEFYWWSAYYFAQPKMWSEIKTKLQDFQNGDLLRLLEETETVLQGWAHPRSIDALDVSPGALENDLSLLASINPLYNFFQEITPCMYKQIGIHIRNNTCEFVQIDN